ncbi:predicted protein [Postia placenta Mad-698-R]|nr:predicted protein [Postia placenta Mad-698-R]
MWAKFSNVLKHRPGTPALSEQDDEPDVLGSVYEQHPNLSVFHEPSEVPFPSPSPPASPSLTGQKNVFKRPKPRIDTLTEPATSSPVISPLNLPKKVKSSLQTLSSELTQRPLQEKAPNTPSDSKFSSLRSIDSMRIPQEKPPITPTADAKFSSLRSILRDSNTPASGRSVRFFSRDAYKTITPDVSATSSEPEEMSFAARLQRAKVQSRRPAQELFSAPTTPSLLTEMPPPNISNIFELSNEVEPPVIPSGTKTPLLDSAFELAEEEADATANVKEEDDRLPMPLSEALPALPQVQHDRSHSFSFGQTVFRSLNSDDSSTYSVKANRGRAVSDTVFHALPPPPLADKGPPEADINDTSGAMIVYASPKEKDPFAANATTYYTPGTMLPPTPPQMPKEKHGRTPSREEDLIWSLRTQLALQSELCVQFEVDLGARDELVRVLNSRLEESERECERRKGVVKNWRKRVSELERAVRGLQEEVDRSREESMDRSMMDEASGQALHQLHRRIESLERERADGDRREQEMREELEARVYELQEVRDELARRDESEQELKAGIRAAKEEMEQMGELTGNHEAIARQIHLNEEAERQRAAAEVAWDEERQKLLSDNESLRSEHISLQAQVTELREEVVRKDAEIGMLKAEVEAQWKHTETGSEKLQHLVQERDELKAEVDALNERISGMEEDWSQGENKKVELENEIQEVWAAKEDLERERTELEDQIRAEHEHSEHLTQALQEGEDRVATLEQERQYALDRAARFEAQIKQRDADAAELSQRAIACEQDAEEAQEEISRLKREHARIVNEQSRTLQDVVAREVEARAGLEAVVREKAEADVHISTMKERLTALQEETERLRRQVHALQQESADKEVKLVNLAKQRQQDKDDINGLNIALDSKQQELELLKRRMSVRGTAGSTPAAASKVPHQRRESSIFGTPSVGGSRPSSALSDTVGTGRDRKSTDTPSTITKAALVKSARTNGMSAPTHAAKRSLEGAMGPPPAMSRSSSTSGTATPTRIPSSSATPRASGAPSAYQKSVTPATQRRMSASQLDPSRLRSTLGSREPLSSASEADEKEKENTAPTAKARRMSLVAA